MERDMVDELLHYWVPPLLWGHYGHRGCIAQPVAQSIYEKLILVKGFCLKSTHKSPEGCQPCNKAVILGGKSVVLSGIAREHGLSGQHLQEATQSAQQCDFARCAAFMGLRAAQFGQQLDFRPVDGLVAQLSPDTLT